MPSASKSGRVEVISWRSTGKKRHASPIAKTPKGRFNRKIPCQPTWAINTPPSVGPSEVPIADIVPSTPIALPIFSLGTAPLTSAMVSAIMVAAPMPCTARAAISNHRLGARAHRSEATVNSAMPISSNRRRPRRSPSRPTLTISAVMLSK
ncbi:hypothetical protein D3C72_1141940 [compost metagenome]